MNYSHSWRTGKATKQDIKVTADKQSNSFFYWLLDWPLPSTQLAKYVLVKKGHLGNWVILPKTALNCLRTFINTEASPYEPEGTGVWRAGWQQWNRLDPLSWSLWKLLLWMIIWEHAISFMLAARGNTVPASCRKSMGCYGDVMVLNTCQSHFTICLPCCFLLFFFTLASCV